MMHAIQGAAQGLGNSLSARWRKCGRRLKVAFGWAFGTGGLSAVIAVCTFIANQTANYIHEQVEAEIRPLTVELRSLRTDVASLQGDVIKISSISDVNNLTAQLSRIETMLQSQQKKPVSAAANTQK